MVFLSRADGAESVGDGLENSLALWGVSDQSVNTMVVSAMTTAIRIPKINTMSLFENFIFTSTKYTKQGATLEIDHFAVKSTPL